MWAGASEIGIAPESLVPFPVGSRISVFWTSSHERHIQSFDVGDLTETLVSTAGSDGISLLSSSVLGIYFRLGGESIAAWRREQQSSTKSG